MSDASRDWKENVAPGEEARFEEYGKRLNALQRMNAKGGKVGRGLHNKSHGSFAASFEVLSDLPEPARHGLFAQPKRYEAIVRFSNGSGKLQKDATGDVRGIAVKVLGVEGEKALGDHRSQDFLAILSSSTPFRNAEEFMALVWAMRSPALALPRLIGALGLVRGIGLLRKLVAGLSQPVGSLAQRTFYSALPIACGPYAVRFSLTPQDAKDAPAKEGPDALADDLVSRVAAGPLTYDMALQFFVDEATTPIEDASVDWTTPAVRVARLVIPQQDPASVRALTLKAEPLSFDPWHALAVHRPLGDMMRARKAAYFASASLRAVAKDPDSLAALS